MKYFMINVSCLLFLFSVVGCGKKSNNPTPPTAVQTATTLMTASPWTMTSITVDGVADNTLFVGLKITFTASGYTAVNGSPVWLTSGTWNFTDNTATSFTRNDGLTVHIDNLTSSSMQLSLTWSQTTTEGGRAQSLAGNNVFVFSH